MQRCDKFDSLRYSESKKLLSTTYKNTTVSFNNKSYDEKKAEEKVDLFFKHQAQG